MQDVTCISYIPKAHRARLREQLSGVDADMAWRERRGLFGSEFHFTGPSRTVVKVHLAVTRWLAAVETPSGRHAALDALD
jgi:hypothetical protein